jgi:hypothetical protein
MKNLLVALVLLFTPACLSSGDPDWERISDSVAVAALDVRTAADLSVAEGIRDELIEIAGYLEVAAPYIAAGEGGVEVREVLEGAYALCDDLISRPGLDEQTKDVLVLVKLAINHAIPYFD